MNEGDGMVMGLRWGSSTSVLKYFFDSYLQGIAILMKEMNLKGLSL